MYKSIKTDKNRDLWYEYELNGAPYKWAQIKPMPRKEIMDGFKQFHRWDETGLSDYNRMVMKWAEKQGRALEKYLPISDIIRMLSAGQTPTGYNIHHLVPRGLGGTQDDVDNIVLIEREAHKKLHEFMKDAKLIQYLSDLEAAGKFKKAYLSIPVLPPVVHESDIPFAVKSAKRVATQQRVNNVKENGRQR